MLLLVSFIVFLLWFVEFYNFSDEYIVLTIYEIFVLASVLGYMLFNGAMINDMFGEFKNII